MFDPNSMITLLNRFSWLEMSSLSSQYCLVLLAIFSSLEHFRCFYAGDLPKPAAGVAAWDQDTEDQEKVLLYRRYHQDPLRNQTRRLVNPIA